MAINKVPKTDKISGDSSVSQKNRVALLVRIGSSQHPLRPRARAIDVTHLAELSIGRGEEERQERHDSKLRLTLADPSLSTQHGRLIRLVSANGLDYSFEDLESTNGSQINGHPISEPTQLEDGDIITTGSTFWRFFRQSLYDAKLLLSRSYQYGSIGYTSSVSPLMLAVFSAIEHIAETDLSVIINGESGTGKEGLAQLLLHEPRLVRHRARKRPFSMAEKLAFDERIWNRGAVERDERAFAFALFVAAWLAPRAACRQLRRVAAYRFELPRLLQENVYVRVGETTPRKANVRFVAATHQDLKKMVADQRFRGDLYARLNGLSVTLPPLRDRREDIGLMLATFLSRSDPQVSGISHDAYRELLLYDWPFNVRELQKTVFVAAAFATAHCEIKCAHLPAELRAYEHTIRANPKVDHRVSQLTHAAQPDPVLSTETEKQLLEALTRHQGNVSRAARDLNTSRVQVYRWLKRLQIDPKSFRR
jgi:hypothetical protein